MRFGNVSVIIPTFNRSYCLTRTIDSVIAQTYPDWTAIIVDDGSTDGTRELIAQRYSAEERVRYVYQHNAGVSAARNHGIELGDGEFVAFLDSDDDWKSWKLELQVACLRRCPDIGMVWTDMLAVNENGDLVDERYLKRMYAAYQWVSKGDLFTRRYPVSEIAPGLAPLFPGSHLFTGDIFSQMIRGNLVHTSTVLLRRDRLNRVGGFDTDLRSGEDYGFHLRTCREGAVGFVDVSSIHYQIGRPDQLTAPQYTVDIARNFLNTIEPVIRADRERISLPDKTIRGTLAYAHAWLGEQLVLAGNAVEARRHLCSSFRQQPGLWAARMYVLSFLPNPAIGRLRRIRQKFRPRRSDPVAPGPGPRPRKVLFLIDTLMGMGGVEGALLKITQQLPRLGWNCAIATFRLSSNQEFVKLFSCPIYHLPLNRVLSWRALGVGFKLYALVARERFDIVHTFFEMSDLWGAPLANSARRAILVSSRRDMGIGRTALQDKLYRLMRNMPHQVQTVSEAVRRTFIERDKLAPERVVTVYNGVDLDRILGVAPWPNLAESFGLDPRGAMILTGSGKVQPVKGIDTLIRAAASVCREFPRTNFLIGGWLEGDYPDELRRLAESLGVSHNVKFIGQSSQFWSILKSVDVYCQLSRSEGHSNGLLEAMACGLPCVATAVGGNPETLEHGKTGFLVEKEDFEGAAARITQLLRRPELRQLMGDAASATVRERFTTEKMAQRIVSLYDELLALHDRSLTSPVSKIR